jgi:hypothetical protein
MSARSHQNTTLMSTFLHSIREFVLCRTVSTLSIGHWCDGRWVQRGEHCRVVAGLLDDRARLPIGVLGRGVSSCVPPAK